MLTYRGLLWIQNAVKEQEPDEKKPAEAVWRN